MVSSAKEFRVLKRLVWVRGAYQNAEERAVKGEDETSIWKMAAASMYERGLSAVFFAERAAKIAHRE